MRKITALLLAIVITLSLVSCSGISRRTVEIDNIDVKMIAHRGLSGLEIENTEAAFIAAGESSHYGIEADVRRTADGRFIICHDSDLERIAGVKIDVGDLNYDDLVSIPMLNKWRIADENIHLCSLEDYISICKKYDKQAILELKSDFTHDEIKKIIEIISSFSYLDRVTFISFNYENLIRVRSVVPDQSVQYLFSEVDDELVDRLVSDKIDVAIKHTKLTKHLVERFHDAGLLVNCWTVDSKIRAEQLIRWGVDYITSNILE